MPCTYLASEDQDLNYARYIFTQHEYIQTPDRRLPDEASANLRKRP